MAHRLILVEDSQLRATWFQQELQRYGVDVALALTGTQGLKRIRANHPDAVILDVTLPDMDGYTLCRELKADPTLDGIPIIILTARNAREMNTEGLNVGADAYIPKDQDAIPNVVTVLRQFGVIGTPGGR